MRNMTDMTDTRDTRNMRDSPGRVVSTAGPSVIAMLFIGEKN
jgi:hypothetical protein